MKLYIISIMGLVLLNGCAGKTTDPRKGGLFSYNPDAYEQRLSDRKHKLHAIEKDTRIQKNKNKNLQKEYSQAQNKLK